MELVYLWVEDYKNIKKQGFNFSPRFNCKFKDKYDENRKLKDNCELIIDENKDYVSIFPENLNITAIVGENGSGKSTIGGELYSKITSYYLDKNKIYSKTNFIYLVYLNKNYYAITNIEKINFKSSNNRKINIKKFKSFIHLEKENIFYSSCALSEYTGREYSFSDPYVKSTNSILGLMRGELNESNEDEINEILNKITFTYKNSKIDKSRINSKISFSNNNVKELRFNSLSFGEKYSLNIFAQIFNRLKRKEPYIIFLDEVTMSMHPDWQRRYINDLIKLYKEYNVHFIITTHSPFLLSDLPKENVIFLKDGKEDNPDIAQTFGANIHTLLSHGFFMKDGLMGEFAKNKILKILKFLNGENKFIDLEVKILPPLKVEHNFFEKNLKPIIEFIGEYFLREKLLKMYEIKFPKSSEEKIRELENEIKRLKNASNKI